MAVILHVEQHHKMYKKMLSIYVVKTQENKLKICHCPSLWMLALFLFFFKGLEFKLITKTENNSFIDMLNTHTVLGKHLWHLQNWISQWAPQCLHHIPAMWERNMFLLLILFIKIFFSLKSMNYSFCLHSDNLT